MYLDLQSSNTDYPEEGNGMCCSNEDEYPDGYWDEYSDGYSDRDTGAGYSTRDDVSNYSDGADYTNENQRVSYSDDRSSGTLQDEDDESDHSSGTLRSEDDEDNHSSGDIWSEGDEDNRSSVTLLDEGGKPFHSTEHFEDNSCEFETSETHYLEKTGWLVPNVPAEGIGSVNFKNGSSPSKKVFVVDFSKPFANNGSRGRVNIANSSGRLTIYLYLIDSGPLLTRETEELNIRGSSGPLTLYLYPQRDIRFNLNVRLSSGEFNMHYPDAFPRMVQVDRPINSFKTPPNEGVNSHGEKDVSTFNFICSSGPTELKYIEGFTYISSPTPSPAVSHGQKGAKGNSTMDSRRRQQQRGCTTSSNPVPPSTSSCYERERRPYNFAAGAGGNGGNGYTVRGNNTFQRAGGKEGTGASYNYNLNYTSNMSRRRRGGRDGITFVNGQRIEAIGGDGGMVVQYIFLFSSEGSAYHYC
ncbi:hypothetical protein PNOK_0843900 [Pyrrhoderma noxium]|uniref:Uncharacterized protein n=1 Tax=Pyrrhoderma noxium TaxID=2282107 RepID=A0A286U7M1_9AGAM|nr:hypothetical protein PNOK_0843900 [Pyrrhoderma noxium]